MFDNYCCYKKSPLLPVSNIAPTKTILGELSLESINKQFFKFKNSCITAPEFLEKRLSDMLKNLFNTKFGQVDFKYTISANISDTKIHIAEPPYFFRVRKVDPKKVLAGNFSLSKNNTYDTLYFPAMNSENDMWAKPNSTVTKYDRLNKPNNSILYTSLEGSTTLVEADVNVGDLFFMICYKRERSMCFSDCSRFIAFNELTEEENMKRYIMFNLLRNEFVRVFPKTYDRQIQYCLSSNIAKYFFINKGVDGIQYPSVRGIGANNFAFWGDSAKRCLTLVCVKFCCLNKRLEGKEALIKIITNGFLRDKKIIWTPPNSELSKKLLNDPALDIFLAK